MDLFYQLKKWWNNRKSPKIDRDYELQEFENNLLIVRIKTGKYKDVKYRYDMVSVKETGFLPVLKFHYTVINPHTFTESYLTESSDFVKIMGDILTDIVTGKHNEIRTHNHKELDSE